MLLLIIEDCKGTTDDVGKQLCMKVGEVYHKNQLGYLFYSLQNASKAIYFKTEEDLENVYEQGYCKTIRKAIAVYRYNKELQNANKILH